MRHICERDARQTRRASIMISVADGAFARVRQLSVYSLRQGNLIADIDVAIHTSNGIGSLEWRMAKLAMRLKVGVRGEIGNENVLGVLSSE